MKSPRNS